MPRGRKAAAKSAKLSKSAKSVAKKAEREARLLEMPLKFSDTFDASDVYATTDTAGISALESAFMQGDLYNADAIRTYVELIAALAARESKIALADNIIAEGNILINHDVEIDFNGFSIIAEDKLASARLLDIRSGTVTLTGNGKVFAMGERSVAVRVFGAISSGVPSYTTLTVGKDISLYAPDAYGILISPNLGAAYGVTVNFAGKIFAHDGICLSNGVRGYGQNLPTINIEHGASITAEEAGGTAIEAAGVGVWKVGAANLSGAIGAILRTGTLNFNHTQFLASGGETFRIEEGSDRELVVKVEKGIYLSRTAAVIGGTPQPLKKFTLKECELYSPLDDTFAPELESLLTIKNCEFETDVEGYLESLTAEEAKNEPEEAKSTVEVELNEANSTIATTKSKEPKATSESTSPKAHAVERMTEIEEKSDDDFVDEMFEFSDELSEKDLKKKKKSQVDSLIKSFKEDGLDDSAELKPAPTLGILSSSEPALELTSELMREPMSELALESMPEPKKKMRKPRALPRVTPVRPFASKLHLIPELTDAETDEQEILRALNSEMPISEQGLDSGTSASKTTPGGAVSESILDVKPPIPVNIGELEAARMALSDAIAEIRKLSAEDYEAGYTDLERALKNAEKVLAKPLADLTMIRDAAAELLDAFDNLEEHDEFSLSDAELDELFYQGAVLKEMVRSHKKAKATPEMPKINADSSSALVQTEITKTASGAKMAQTAKTPSLPEPDFAVLSDALTTISTINLSKYTKESQAALLAELDRAQNVLMNLQSTQAEIDAVASSLLGQMSQLKIQPRHHATNVISQKTSTPAPVVSAILPATMVDELAPANTWSIGVTMIDELEPFRTDATTREKMLRAMYPWLKAGLQVMIKPFRKISKSIVAGFRAGMRTYRETLRAN